mgnify:FL=1
MTNKFKIFIVNLKKDKNRKQSILNELKKQHLENFEIIEAFDGYNIKKNRLNLLTSKDEKFLNPNNTNMNSQEICCALSHIKIYKKIIKYNLEYALILEDDAVFVDNFSNNLKKFIIKNLKHEKQIMLLSELWEFYKKPLDKEDNYEIVNVTNAVFTHSYFINRKAAETLILFNFPIKTVADNFIIFKIYCGIKITGLNPFLLKQDKNKFTSSIPIDNDLKKIFLFRRFIYKFKNRVLKKFKIFKSHKNLQL